MTSRQRQATDVMIGAGGFLSVVAGMSIMNAEVRSQVANIIAGDPTGQLSSITMHAQLAGHELLRNAVEYRTDNGPILGFGLVAVVLAFLMFRT